MYSKKKNNDEVANSHIASFVNKEECDIESRKEGRANLDVLTKALQHVVMSTDRVGCSNYCTPGRKGTKDARLGDTDAL